MNLEAVTLNETSQARKDLCDSTHMWHPEESSTWERRAVVLAGRGIAFQLRKVIKS